MKRSPLVRRTPLARGKPMKRGRARRIDRETPAEQTHKRLIRNMWPCALAAEQFCAGPCDGPLECAHLGRGGIGMKHGDWTETTMLCRRHHGDLDGYRGVFRGLDRDVRRAVLSVLVVRARAFVGMLVAAEEAPF